MMSRACPEAFRLCCCRGCAGLALDRFVTGERSGSHVELFSAAYLDVGSGRVGILSDCWLIVMDS